MSIHAPGRSDRIGFPFASSVTRNRRSVNSPSITPPARFPRGFVGELHHHPLPENFCGAAGEGAGGDTALSAGAESRDGGEAVTPVARTEAGAQEPRKEKDRSRRNDR